jgi:hypothetical protein
VQAVKRSAEVLSQQCEVEPVSQKYPDTPSGHGQPSLKLDEPPYWHRPKSGSTKMKRKRKSEMGKRLMVMMMMMMMMMMMITMMVIMMLMKMKKKMTIVITKINMTKRKRSQMRRRRRRKEVKENEEEENDKRNHNRWPCQQACKGRSWLQGARTNETHGLRATSVQARCNYDVIMRSSGAWTQVIREHDEDNVPHLNVMSICRQ